MRKTLSAVCLTLLLLTCQVEDGNVPAPEDAFIKYIGGFARHEAADLEPIYNEDSSDVTGFIVFGTQQAEGGEPDYYVAQTDAGGNLIASNTFDLEVASLQDEGFIIDLDEDGEGDENVISSEAARSIKSIPGGYLFIGNSTITIAGTDNSLTFITVGILNAELEFQSDVGGLLPIIEAVNGRVRNVFGNDIVFLPDGSLVIAGAIAKTPNDRDFYLKRFGRDTVYYTFTDLGLTGVGRDDVFVKALPEADGNLAVFGYSEDLGTRGELGTNVTYFKINVDNGGIENSNSIGISDSPSSVSFDVLADVILKPGGYFAVGTSTINDRKRAFFMDIDRSGLGNRKDTIAAAGSLQTEAMAVTATPSNDFVIVGRYTNFRSPEGPRGGEILFYKTNSAGEAIAGTENNFGLRDGNDVAVDAVTLPDGKIVMLANVDFGGGVQLLSLIKLNEDGELDE